MITFFTGEALSSNEARDFTTGDFNSLPDSDMGFLSEALGVRCLGVNLGLFNRFDEESSSCFFGESAPKQRNWIDLDGEFDKPDLILMFSICLGVEEETLPMSSLLRTLVGVRLSIFSSICLGVLTDNRAFCSSDSILRFLVEEELSLGCFGVVASAIFSPRLFSQGAVFPSCSSVLTEVVSEVGMTDLTSFFLLAERTAGTLSRFFSSVELLCVLTDVGSSILDTASLVASKTLLILIVTFVSVGTVEDCSSCSTAFRCLDAAVEFVCLVVR